MITLVNPSCKSHEAVVQHGVEWCSMVEHSYDTIVVQDSVFVSEKVQGDTVYLTRVEWRERWRTRVERDTVVDVRVEKEVVQLPPERYVPKFYRWCTVALWVGMISVIIYILIRCRFR